MGMLNLPFNPWDPWGGDQVPRFSPIHEWLILMAYTLGLPNQQPDEFSQISLLMYLLDAWTKILKCVEKHINIGNDNNNSDIEY